MSKVCVVTGGGSGMGLAAADLLHINALGTVYVNQEFSKRMHKGSVIVDIASMLAFSCENRMGTPEELGFAIATLADERNSYLAGVDILCDGGTIRGMNEFKKPQ